MSGSDGETWLTIGDLVGRTGVSEGTLRMWERRHGFPSPERLASGHRRYVESDAELVRQVMRERGAGLSLAAAISRARESAADSQPSIFAGLRRRRPELQATVLRKPLLLALSRAIEDESCARAERALLFGAFQRERFYRQSEHRWRELARTAELAVVFADFARPRRPARGPIELPIDTAAPLNREWAIVCEARATRSAWRGSSYPGEPPTRSGARVRRDLERGARCRSHRERDLPGPGAQGRRGAGRAPRGAQRSGGSAAGGPAAAGRRDHKPDARGPRLTARGYRCRISVHTLERHQVLPIAPHEAFEFFADAFNLEAITPPWLHFKVETPGPIVMGAGALIRYRLRLHGLPVRWLTRIEAWNRATASRTSKCAAPTGSGITPTRSGHTRRGLRCETASTTRFRWARPGGSSTRCSFAATSTESSTTARRQSRPTWASLDQ